MKKTLLFGVIVALAVFGACGGSGGGSDGGGTTPDPTDGGGDSVILPTDGAGNQVDTSTWPSFCLINLSSPATGTLQDSFAGQPARPSTVTLTIGEGLILTVDGEPCDYLARASSPWPTVWYDAICQTTIECGGYETRYLIDGANDDWTLTTFMKYNESLNWWTFGDSGYSVGGGGGGGACSSCLSSCQGISGCCCGSGCICDDVCTDACNDG